MNWTEKTNYKKEMMKRRLTYNGKQVYIKKLHSKYAIVSHNKEGNVKQFKVNIKDLADI
tara:strand:- start:11751 stop:11927 length:177 start_codon:yes stop_codon:yes gene_type:complete